MTKQRTDKELNMLFLWGFLLGTLCFLAIYGFSTLDVTYSGWIFKCDIDVRQHYIGWISYRNSDWSFPLGMLYNLSYPVPSSIVYTDSIPLVALFFKMIRGILPETFQYFGWFTLISYALTGAFFTKLMGRLVDNKIACMVYPLVAVLSYPMLARTFYHTSLTAQWIIIWAIDLWISKIYNEKIVRQILSWSILGILCAGIHLYFMPMVLGIMCACYFEEFLFVKNNKPFIEFMLSFASTCLCALLVLYIFGAFSGASTGEYWVGDFNSNLNCFINSFGRSIILPKLEVVSSFQYEGAAYLGLGVMTALAAGIVALIIKKQYKGTFITKDNLPRAIATLVMCSVFFILAVCPVISIGSKIIYTIPYPELLLRVLGTFRSNGRFIWPVMYIIFLYVPILLERVTKTRYAIIISLAVLIQVIDLSPRIMSRYEFSHEKYNETLSEWDRADIDTDKYKHIVSFIDNVKFLMKAAYYGSRVGVTTNNYYYARNVDEKIQEELAKYGEELEEKNPRDDVIYAFNLETYEKYKDCGLHFYKGEKCIYGTKDALSGKSELTEDEIDSIKWNK